MWEPKRFIRDHTCIPIPIHTHTHTHTHTHRYSKAQLQAVLFQYEHTVQHMRLEFVVPSAAR